MDPLTAALQLANTLAEIVKLAMEGQTPAQREAMWNRHMAQQEKWDDFWGKLFHIKDEPKP